MVREAQDITQSELAQKLGITQAAIAQFEKTRAALSAETIINMSPILNLNPDYLLSRIGNPFKQNVPEEIIKMFLFENPIGDIDFSLIKLIAEKNHQAIFLFLKPLFGGTTLSGLTHEDRDIAKKEIARWNKQSRQGFFVFALLIRDDDDNIFLFKRKDNIFLKESDFLPALKEAIENKRFEFDTVGIRYPIYRAIKDWTAINATTIGDLFKHKHYNDSLFLTWLISEVSNRQTSMKDKSAFEKIKAKIRNMSPEESSALVADLTPKIATVLKKNLNPSTEFDSDSS